MLIDEYRKTSISKYALYLSGTMGVSSGDRVYMLLRKSYFTLMTEAQYSALLSEYKSRIDSETDPLKRDKLFETRFMIERYANENEYIVDSNGFVYFGVDIFARYSLGDSAGVYRTASGYNIWNPSLFQAYFPEITTLCIEGDLTVFYDEEKSSCMLAIKGSIGVDEGASVVMTFRENFFEVRTVDDWQNLIFRLGERIKTVEKDDVRNLLIVLKRKIIRNSHVATVNSNGRIYIPLERARQYRLCDASSVRVDVVKGEGFVRIVNPAMVDIKADSKVTGGDRKPR